MRLARSVPAAVAGTADGFATREVRSRGRFVATWANSLRCRSWRVGAGDHIPLTAGVRMSSGDPLNLVESGAGPTGAKRFRGAALPVATGRRMLSHTHTAIRLLNLQRSSGCS